MQVVLFEDERVDDLCPASLMQPAMALRTAGLNALQLVGRLGWPMHYVVRDYLQELTRLELGDTALDEGPHLFVNARLVPRLSYVDRLRELGEQGRAAVWTAGDDVCAALVPQGVRLPEPLTPANCAQALMQSGPPDEQAHLQLLRYPHDLVRLHMEAFSENLEALVRLETYGTPADGVYVNGAVSIAQSAVLDPANGPIVLEDGARIGEFAYVSGPAHVGRNSRLIDHAAIKDGVALAPVCKVGGEVECSSFMPYSNKQHHGFIGHAFIGSWVNMGAGTSNSDLKNTYGNVRVEHRGERIETGMQFLGCVVGDYSKTAINTSIFTGKIIGCASMIYGFVTRNVPSFCNWARSLGEVTECPPEVAAAAQKRMFARRGVEQTDAHVRLLRRAFELTRAERLISSEPPQL